MKKTYLGSCHCGAVRFSCDLDLAAGTTRCNCSFCTKSRFWLAFARKGEFRLLQGEEALTNYQWTPPHMKAPFLSLLFCRTCGVRGFTKGGHLPALGGEFHAVNLACLDDAEADLAAAPVRYIDGRHDDYERTPEYRYL
jgi:hypothetical protein